VVIMCRLQPQKLVASFTISRSVSGSESSDSDSKDCKDDSESSSR
jgi:hypothetical protein